MYYVYRIQSRAHPAKTYTGWTTDLRSRLRAHNSACCDATKPFMPWKLVFYASFESKQLAQRFERYLKTGSGQAFGNKRLWQAT